MNEIWRDIKGFEGVYQVSNLGNVKSLPKQAGSVLRKERVLRPRPHNSGYLTVSLGVNYSYKTYYIHRLVAETFLGTSALLQVNHIDEDKTNNNVENLEWVTAKENMNHKNLGYKKWNTRGRNEYICYDSKTKTFHYFDNSTGYDEMSAMGITRTDRSKANKKSHKTKGLIITNLELI